MKKIKNKSQKKRTILLTFLIVVVCFILVGFYLTRKQSDNKNSDISAKTTSTVISAQPDFTTDDTAKETTDASPRDNVGGGIIDTSGTSVTPSDPSGATSTANGELVVYSPSKNSMLENGSTISGTSSLAKISYRIVDTDVGVLSGGTLDVVNGKFSGTIQFKSNAKDGRLDFFNTTSDGNEFNNISVPVNFR